MDMRYDRMNMNSSYEGRFLKGNGLNIEHEDLNPEPESDVELALVGMFLKDTRTTNRPLKNYTCKQQKPKPPTKTELQRQWMEQRKKEKGNG